MLAIQRQRRADVTECRKYKRVRRLTWCFCLISIPGVTCTAFSQGAQNVENTGTASADQFLSSYEGQQVSAVQIAGRTEDIAAKYAPELVQKAGEPFSKEKVNQSAAALKAAEAKPLGRQTFGLVSVDAATKSGALNGRKVEARGLLYRDGAWADLNLTSIKPISSDCAK